MRRGRLRLRAGWSVRRMGTPPSGQAVQGERAMRWWAPRWLFAFPRIPALSAKRALRDALGFGVSQVCRTTEDYILYIGTATGNLKVFLGADIEC